MDLLDGVPTIVGGFNADSGTFNEALYQYKAHQGDPAYVKLGQRLASRPGETTFKSVEEEREQLMKRLDELEREESSNLREKLDAAIKVIKSICFLASDALLCLS